MLFFQDILAGALVDAMKLLVLSLIVCPFAVGFLLADGPQLPVTRCYYYRSSYTPECPPNYCGALCGPGDCETDYLQGDCYWFMADPLNPCQVCQYPGPQN